MERADPACRKTEQGGMGQARRGSPSSCSRRPLKQPRKVGNGVWRGWGGGEAPVREFGSLHSAPFFTSYNHRQRYTEYFGEFPHKSLLQGKWHHGLHNMFRRDSFRSVHAFFRPTLRLKENPQKSCHALDRSWNSKLESWDFLSLFLSLSLSLSLPPLALEKQLWRG